MEDFIKKYGSYLLPLILGGVAFYDRFVVMELENELNKKEIQRQVQELKTNMKNELKQVDDHEKRLRFLECGRK